MNMTVAKIFGLILGAVAVFGVGSKILNRGQAADQEPRNKPVIIEERYILALKPDYKNAKELGAHIRFLSETFQVDSKLLIAISFQESSFNHLAVNNNDLGLFQLNFVHQIQRKGRPYTIQELTQDWRLNSILAAQYLRECMAYQKNSKLEPFTCYHSFTYEKALVYQQSVKKHILKLNTIK